MTRKATVVLATTVIWLMPSAAYAADQEHLAVDWVVGALTLVAAAILLFLALGLSRVARGSAMAENISFVVVSCTCLAASVLADWSGRFATDSLVQSQLQLASQLLIVSTIAFLCVYFFRVRSALKKFLELSSSEDALDMMHASGSVTDG